MDNVAGVKIPKFEQVMEGVDNKMSLTGLGAGGKAIQVLMLIFPLYHHGAVYQRGSSVELRETLELA